MQQLFFVKGLGEKTANIFCHLQNSYENNAFGCPYKQTKEQSNLEGSSNKVNCSLRERAWEGWRRNVLIGRLERGSWQRVVSGSYRVMTPAKVSDSGFLQQREVRKSRPWSNDLYQAFLFYIIFSQWKVAVSNTSVIPVSYCHHSLTFTHLY